MSKLVGDRIYDLRKKLGLSQEEFANRIGVSRQVVSKWEGNLVIPLTDKLKKISEEFNISYDEIFSDYVVESDNNKDRKVIKKYLLGFLGLIVAEFLVIFIYTYVQDLLDKKNTCVGIQTYYVDKIYDSSDINYYFVTLKNKDNDIKTVKISRLVSSYLSQGSSYEFTFKGRSDRLDIDYIFKNDEIINIKYVEDDVSINDGISCK